VLSVSLLYPSGTRPRPRTTGAPDASDLALDPIARALALESRQVAFVAGVLAELCADPGTIEYRQQTLADLRRLPGLAAGLGDLLPSLRNLGGAARLSWGDEPSLLQLADRLGELDLLVSCAEGLFAAFEAHAAALAAPALRRLHEELALLRELPDYRALAEVLPELRARLDDMGSVTLGINLDGQFRPAAATILSINPGRFGGKGSLLDRLLGQRPEGEATRGISALYKADAERAYSSEHALFRDLSQMLERALAPVVAALDRFKGLGGRGLAAIEPELSLLLGTLRLAQDLEAQGLPLCRPELAPTDERACAIVGGYSLDLALRMRAAGGGEASRVVASDIGFDEQARIQLLTGPNSGGKTTYTRAVGQAQVLFQAGLLVPGVAARLSPVDGLYSHFAAAERPEQEGGRLAEELARLQGIFAQVTPRSLLLINEPFTSTDHAAARLLARDLLEALRLLGARAVYVTHLHELVEEAIPEGLRAGGVVSLVARAELPGEGALTPTYRVVPGRPQAQGYARELARRYGLSYEQIAAQLRARGVIG
jgi:DNA mismatch repair protein MutS